MVRPGRPGGLFSAGYRNSPRAPGAAFRPRAGSVGAEGLRFDPARVSGIDWSITPVPCRPQRTGPPRRVVHRMSSGAAAAHRAPSAAAGPGRGWSPGSTSPEPRPGVRPSRPPRRLVRTEPEVTRNPPRVLPGEPAGGMTGPGSPWPGSPRSGTG